MNTEMIMMMAKMMPEDAIIDQLYDAIRSYKMNKTEGNKESIFGCCMLMHAKIVTNKVEMPELLAELERHRKFDKAFNSREGQN